MKLTLESARVKLESEWEDEGAPAVPPSLYTEHDKQEVVLKPELLQPPDDLPTIKAEYSIKQEWSSDVKQECSDAEPESCESYASSECSGEYLQGPWMQEERVQDPWAQKEYIQDPWLQEENIQGPWLQEEYLQDPWLQKECKPCFVRIEIDPIIELMCTLLRKKQKVLLCECGKKFKLEGKLVSHLKKCSVMRKKLEDRRDGDRYVCIGCRVGFADKQCLDGHLKNCLYQQKSQKYICDICSKHYSVRDSFILHVNMCMQSELKVTKLKLPYICKCTKRFATQNLLMVHERVHSGKRPFKCEICGKRFRQYPHLKQHAVRHKYHTEKRFFTCDYCGKNFAYKSNIANHMPIHTKEKHYSCGTCGKRMANNNHMSRHMLTHYPESAKRTHPCDVCKKVFLEKSNLMVHMRVHNGLKPYTCRVCSMKFAYLTSFRRHETIHRGRKKVGPFLCCVCKKLFAVRSLLVKHARYHVWVPDGSRKSKVKRLDCSVRLARLPLPH